MTKSQLEAPTSFTRTRHAASVRGGGAFFYVKLLGIQATDAPTLLSKVESGFRFSSLTRFQKKADLQTADLVKVIQIPERTLARRKKEGRLTSQESDRLLRASRVFGKALALFGGDLRATRHWLESPALALGNRTPWDVAATEAGAREVEKIIGALEHGVFL